MNDAGQKATGTTLRHLSKIGLHALISGISQQRIDRLLSKLRKRASGHVTFRIGHSDPKGQWRLSRIHLVYLDDLRPTYVAYVQNITRYQEARRAAHTAEAMLSTAIEALPDGFVLYDAADKLVICNQRYREIYEKSASAMRPGETFRDILKFGLENGQYADGVGREDAWLDERMVAHQTLSATVEQRLMNGQWLRIVERPISGGGRVGLRIDITELKNNQEQLEHHARTDYLTNLMNRRGLGERIKNIASTISPCERIAVLHVDLDKFKAVNDAQGHDAGDFVLRHCAKILCENLPNTNSVARVGGDEFIVLFVTTGDDQAVMNFASSLIRKISKPVSFRDRICNIGASIGIAFYQPRNDEDTRSALTGADFALNEAKKAGRGVCRIFEPAMRNEAMHNIQMGQQIRIGIHDNQFEPFFQPQVNAKTQQIIGFEALIRWRHPERGLVPAFEFLIAAEQAGLMDDLDNVVMDRSCFALAQLMEWGVQNPCVSINMSTAQLRDPDIGKRLMRYCRAYAISPSNLRIELLESTLLDDRSDVIVGNVHTLIGLGFAVELDDFGTGHAAIATLRKFAVSRIKIDRSLVANIDQEPELQVITGAIIGLAGQLGVNALAEGVETKAEQDMLVNLGCACAQGYYHARPMPLSKLRSWVETQTAASVVAGCHQSPELDSTR